MEFPLSGPPTGANVTKATFSAYHVSGTTLTHSLRGYVGNGTIEVADIEAGGTAVTFPASAPATRTTVHVTSLITPTVVASGWAGLAMRRDEAAASIDKFYCRANAVEPPTLTIDYLAP